MNDQLCMDSTVTNVGGVALGDIGGIAGGVVGGGGGGGIGDDRNSNERYDAILIQQQQVLRQLELQHLELKRQIDDVKKDLDKSLRIVNTNLNRIMIQPPRQATRQQNNMIIENQQLNAGALAIANAADEDRRLIVQLSSCPKNLHLLWREYQFGLGGRKPAKFFTAVERGANKCSFSRRKVFWDVISKHVNAGYLANSAIVRVYECYGQKVAVTKILNAMMKDRMTGGHPNLQI